MKRAIKLGRGRRRSSRRSRIEQIGDGDEGVGPAETLFPAALRVAMHATREGIAATFADRVRIHTRIRASQDHEAAI